MSFAGYILQSLANGSYYVGQTKEIESRIVKHNRGEVLSTRPHKPWKLVYTAKFGTRREAIRWEREVKSHKSRFYIEKLINPERGAAR